MLQVEVYSGCFSCEGLHQLMDVLGNSPAAMLCAHKPMHVTVGILHTKQWVCSVSSWSIQHSLELCPFWDVMQYYGNRPLWDSWYSSIAFHKACTMIVWETQLITTYLYTLHWPWESLILCLSLSLLKLVHLLIWVNFEKERLTFTLQKGSAIVSLSCWTATNTSHNNIQ